MKSCIPGTSLTRETLEEALPIGELRRLTRIRTALERSLKTFQDLQAFRKRLKRQKSLSPSK